LLKKVGASTEEPNVLEVEMFGFYIAKDAEVENDGFLVHTMSCPEYIIIKPRGSQFPLEISRSSF
jgi:hypothetical protein